MYGSYFRGSYPPDKYPPPGAFRYTTPKPSRNGSAHRFEDEIDCVKPTSCFWWCISTPLFHLRFWKIVMFILLVVTTGHFYTVMMFHRITEPLFVVKYDVPGKGANDLFKRLKQEKPDQFVQAHHRKMNYLIPSMNKWKLTNFSSPSNSEIAAKEKSITSLNATNHLLNSKSLNQSRLIPRKKDKSKSNLHRKKKKKILNVGSREKPSNLSMSVINLESNLKLCPPVPPNLEGPVKVNLNNIPPLEIQEESHPELTPGGRFKPSECRARHKVAIIIPFRDRAAHLAVFLHNLHPFLQKQQIDYAIYIVEQAGNGKFNRAMLMNVGSIEALKLYPYDCFVFHDIDLIPEDDRNLYTCPVQPRHMSVAINTMKYKLPYNDIFGGVSAMTVSQFQTVNGFSNRFWGWGGEDDDMSNRIKFHKFYISRYPANVARYTMMPHKKDNPNPFRYKYLNEGKRRYSSDGLNSAKYKMLDIQLRKLYTWFNVELFKT